MRREALGRSEVEGHMSGCHKKDRGWLWKTTSTCALQSHWPIWTAAIFTAKRPHTLKKPATSFCLLPAAQLNTLSSDDPSSPPFSNFTVDIVFPVLRGPGRTQFQPVNASLKSSMSRYRTGQETQADLPSELAKPLSLRSHLSTAILRVPMMTAIGSWLFMQRIQWHRSMSHTSTSHEDDPVTTHESGKLTVHQRACVAYIHVAPTLIM